MYFPIEAHHCSVAQVRMCKVEHFRARAKKINFELVSVSASSCSAVMPLQKRKTREENSQKISLFFKADERVIRPENRLVTPATEFAEL